MATIVAIAETAQAHCQADRARLARPAREALEFGRETRVRVRRVRSEPGRRALELSQPVVDARVDDARALEGAGGAEVETRVHAAIMVGAPKALFDRIKPYLSL